MPIRAAQPAHRGYVYGLEVESSMPLPLARPPRGDLLPKVLLKEVTSEELAEMWGAGETTSIANWKTAAGRPVLSIDSDPEHGYRIAAPAQGTYLVSKDGREISCVLPAVPAWLWQRLCFSQVLPLTAALCGLSPFHASAVAFGERALGFVAVSGAGKTSVATYLTSRGASFVTDDVMAVGPSSNGVHVHPGPGVARVYLDQLREIDAQMEGGLGEIVGRSDKIQLAIPPIDRAVSLGALYFLERSSRFRRLRIARRPSPDPVRVLSSSFVTYVDKPEFQLAHLDVCSHIVQSVPVFDVSIPEAEDALEVARRIESHAQR